MSVCVLVWLFCLQTTLSGYLYTRIYIYILTYTHAHKCILYMFIYISKYFNIFIYIFIYRHVIAEVERWFLKQFFELKSPVKMISILRTPT